jgi:translation initiation factor IF-2
LQQTKDSKDKVRVFALARNLGVDSKTVIDLCKSMGFDVKSQLASLEPDQVDALKQRVAKGVKAAPEAPKPGTAPVPPKDKRIINLAGKPKAEVRPGPENRAPEQAEPEPAARPDVPLEPEPVAEAPAAEAPAVVEQPSAPAVETVAAVAPPAAAPTPAVINPPPAVPMTPQAAPIIPTAAAPTPPQPPAPPVAPRPQAPATGRILNLSSGRPSAVGPRPPGGGPAAPTRVPPPAVGAGTTGRPGTPTTPTTTGRGPVPPARTGPGAAGPGRPAGPGAPTTPGAAPRGLAERHRRPEGQRTIGTVAQPGAARTPSGEVKKPVVPGQTKFTAEQLQALREGRSVTEVLKKAPPPGATPAPGEEPEGGDDDGKKKGLPGKIVGRDTRHTDRAKRQEQRKVRQSSVVIQGNNVEVSEEAFGSKRGRRAAMLKKARNRLPGTVERKGKVPIVLPITVRSLSEAIGTKVGELIFKLKDLTNSLYTINSPVETEVAELIATEKGIEFEIVRPKSAEQDLFIEHETAAGDETKLEPRAPVVTIMGHVDHGKTSLLDKIRKSNVVDTEAGGITQVIRAWRVIHNGKPITFLDTPGHEAFTKMRARGANVTDIAVIVVAANDGVMPQTEEAISHAKAAGVSIVVAINKVDLPDANLRRTEQQLYGLGLIPDTMGGDVQFVQTSAAKGTGIGELLDTLSLVAEVKDLRANPHKPASGTCLEAYLDPEEGVLATLLVQQGTLRRGDVIVCGSAYGRARAMYDDLGRPLQEAGPSVPVRVTGLDEVPNADDHFHVVAELAKAREIGERRKERAQESQFKPRVAVRLETLGEHTKAKIAELKVVLKAEARGSVEAIRKELEKLVHEEVRVRLLHAGIGAITESDVQLALASPEDTIVVGFNVVPDDQAMRLAEERGISIREYQIIYKLTEDIKSALEGKLKPREEVIHLGRAIVRETFKVSRVGTIAGCYVTQGTIERSAKVRVIREGAVVYPPADRVASLESLKRFKEDAREVREGFECGMKVAGYDDVKVNDVIEAYRIEQVQRTL